MKKSIYWHDLENNVENQLSTALKTTLNDISFSMVVCADSDKVMTNIRTLPNSVNNLKVLANALSKDSKIIKDIESNYLHCKISKIREGRFVFLSFSHEYNIVITQ